MPSDRVKTLRLLTLPCQKTNPDGVICGEKRWRLSLFWMLGVLDGVICGGKRWRLSLFWMLGVLDVVNCGGKVLGFAIIALWVKWDAAFCNDVACLIPP